MAADEDVGSGFVNADEDQVSLGELEDDLLESMGYYGDGYVSSLSALHESDIPLTATSKWPESGLIFNYTCKMCFPNIIFESGEMCEHKKEWNKCTKCKGKGVLYKAPTRWMLDSGASLHFTENKKYLKNVQKLDEEISVCTANSIIFVNEKGEVLIIYKTC